MRSRSRAVVLGFLSSWTSIASARADVVFSLDLDLSDAAAVDAAIARHGGRRSGGRHGPQGWTTTSRGDFIEIPLPMGLDTSRGRLVVTVRDFEMDPPFHTTYWGFELVSLGAFGAGESRLPSAGRAHLSAGYRGYWDEGPSFVAQAFWNLFDATCTEWMRCTTETATRGGFIEGPGAVTWTFRWDGPVAEVWFEREGETDHARLDLSATSPGGRLAEERMRLTLNNCGGATQIVCGSWFEEHQRGGPVGVTYVRVSLSIEDDPRMDAGAPPGDAGGEMPPDAAVATDGGDRPDGTGAMDAASRADVEGGPRTDAPSPRTTRVARGGCACSAAPRAGTQAWATALLASVLAASWRARRRARRVVSRPRGRNVGSLQ
ncbi:MAG: hypothetical protein NZ898_15565 [Myxococcota bacterium]|nr:hypothetical protein [Myxococcota bacterium]MDW8361565.1 hypothetical protein [Myxococcales bacterium]